MIKSSPGDTCCIILLHWNDPDRVLAATNRIRSWESFTPNLLVVDNGSSEEAWQRICTTLPEEHVIRSEKNLGFAGGNNLGIRQAVESGFKLIMLLNTDVILEEMDAQDLCDHMAADDDLAVLGPMVRETRLDGVHLLAGGRDIGRYMDTRIEIPEQQNGLNASGADALSHIPGMLVVIRSMLFNKVGLLDERFFFSGEIADFCVRATKSGYEIRIDPEIVVEHDTTLGDPERRTLLYGYYSLRNRFLYISKHHPTEGLRLKMLWTIRGLRQLLGHLLTGRRKAARSLALAIWHGNRNTFGNQNDRFIHGD